MRYEVRNPTGELVGIARISIDCSGRKYIEMPLLEPLRPRLSEWDNEENLVCSTVVFKVSKLRWKYEGFYNDIPTLIVAEGRIHLLATQSWFRAV